MANPCLPRSRNVSIIGPVCQLPTDGYAYDRSSPHSFYYHISLNAKHETPYQVFWQLGFPHLVLGHFYIVNHPVPFDGRSLVVIDGATGAGLPVSWLPDAAKINYPTSFCLCQHGVFREPYELGKGIVL